MAAQDSVQPPAYHDTAEAREHREADRKATSTDLGSEGAAPATSGESAKVSSNNKKGSATVAGDTCLLQLILCTPRLDSQAPNGFLLLPPHHAEYSALLLNRDTRYDDVKTRIFQAVKTSGLVGPEPLENFKMPYDVGLLLEAVGEKKSSITLRVTEENWEATKIYIYTKACAIHFKFALLPNAKTDEEAFELWKREQEERKRAEEERKREQKAQKSKKSAKCTVQ